MTALSRTVCVLVLGCGLAGSALAAMDSAGSANDQNAAPNAPAPTHLSQRLRNDLAKAGFTDITIMPSSFLVRAKDSQGNPVMMVINPDSLTELTEHSEPPVSGAIKGAATGSPSAGATNAPTPPARP
jgi:hypothetical protein